MTTIRERWFSGHCWRSENEVVSDLVLWEPKHGKRSIGQARTFFDLLETKTGLLNAMDDRDDWRKRSSHGGSAEVDLVVVVVEA